MKYILLILLVVATHSLKAQESCALPGIVVTAMYDLSGHLQDSCGVDGTWYLSNYKKVPRAGIYYDRQRTYVRIFVDGKLVMAIKGRRLKMSKYYRSI